MNSANDQHRGRRGIIIAAAGLILLFAGGLLVQRQRERTNSLQRYDSAKQYYLISHQAYVHLQGPGKSPAGGMEPAPRTIDMINGSYLDARDRLDAAARASGMPDHGAVDKESAQ